MVVLVVLNAFSLSVDVTVTYDESLIGAGQLRENDALVEVAGNRVRFR